MKNFAKRNILIYFRDIQAVLLSLLGVFIVFGLYSLFLGDNLANNLSVMADPALFVTSWLVAGLSAITPISTALGAMGALIADRASGADRDFLASPLKRYKIVGGYLIGGLLACGILSFVVLGLGGVWLAINGASLPNIGTLLAIVGVQILSCLAGGCLSFFILTFLHTNSAFMGVSTVVGTLLGFITGLYLPIGQLPTAMQWVVKVFPGSHAALLMRHLLLEGTASASIEGVPDAAIAEIQQMMGFRFYVGGALFPQWGSVLVLAGSAVLFFFLSVFNYRRKV